MAASPKGCCSARTGKPKKATFRTASPAFAVLVLLVLSQLPSCDAACSNTYDGTAVSSSYSNATESVQIVGCHNVVQGANVSVHGSSDVVEFNSLTVRKRFFPASAENVNPGSKQ